MRLVAYVRVSTAEQAEEGVSLSAQENRLRAWATARGDEVVFIASDAGFSATIPPEERPAFVKALDLLRTKKADGLVVTASDRLSRTVTDTLDLADTFNKRGWALLSMRESMDSSSAMGRFTLTMRAAVSELERGLISERTAEGLRELRRVGKRFCGFIPWGKTLAEDGETLVDCPDEIRFTDEVARLAEKGHTSYDIAEMLNAQLGPHPRLKVAWNRRRVEKLKRGMRRASGIRKAS